MRAHDGGIDGSTAEGKCFARLFLFFAISRLFFQPTQSTNLARPGGERVGSRGLAVPIGGRQK